MGWQLTPYFYLLVASGSLSAVLAVYVWLRRGAGAGALAVLLAGASVWAVGYALESGAPGLGAKIFWAKVQYLGISTVPLAWLAFCIRYTGREGWLTRRNLALLGVLPLVTLALVWTNGAHSLVWSSTVPGPSPAFPALDFGYGPWFFVYWIYAQVLILTGSILLLPALVRSLRLYRRQGVALLVAAAIPWVGNLAYVLGLVPVPGLDLTPFAFLLGGTALVVGLFGFRLLDLVPVARENVVEGMEDGVIVADPQDRVVDVNPAAAEILGRQAREAVGMTLTDLAPAWWKASFEEHRRTGGTVRREVKGNESPDPRDYELTLSPVVDRKGRRKGRLALLRDVTERRRAEEERARRTAELARSNAELEQFAHSVSHDLRAPLRSIDGFSRILLEDHAEELGGEAADHLGRVRESAQRMSLLIDALLDLSRVTRVEMRRTDVDLSALAREVAGELERRDPERDARFEIQENLTAEGDARLLRAVVENLLDNAWKFTSREPRATIEFGADRREDGATAFFVRDDGAGFDPQYADSLFGPFQRLHAEDEFEGTGMGLATVARIVHRHGGRAWAEGEPGMGATFFFTLHEAIPTTPRKLAADRR
jgi:PAS domain S-box-containing protein